MTQVIWYASPEWYETQVQSGMKLKSGVVLKKPETMAYFFLDTPTVRPLLPVVLVCWPLTRRLKWKESEK